MARRNHSLKIWVAILMLCVVVGTTQAGLTLYIQRRFAIDQMGLDVENDILLIDNGDKNPVFRSAKLFRETTKLPAKLNRVELTWIASKHEEQYSLRVTSSDLEIMQNPVIKLPQLQGTVPKVSKTFEVYLHCVAKGQVYVHFALNYTHFKKSTGHSILRRLEFSVAKICHQDETVDEESTESSKKTTVDRTIVITVSASLALLVCVVVGAVFFWRYVKRIRRKFGFDSLDETRERLAPRTRESFSSSNISIPTTSQVPTVVYSPKGKSSGYCFTKIAKHTTHSCSSQENLNINTASSSVSCNGNFDNGQSSSKNGSDLKLFTQISIADDDVFTSEQCDVALIDRNKQENTTLSLAKDSSDKHEAFATLNGYWSEKLGDSVKPREEVEIRTEVLGEGTFGRVLRGKLLVACKPSEGNVDLAVKICQDDIEFEHMVSFVNEAILMKRLSHGNLLDLLGVVLQPTTAPLILTPYMSHGDLHKFLRHSRGIGIRRQLIGSRQLVNFASQIARGMEYLASQKVVHRDLAARNCFVDENLNVKIGDFGLSREVKQFDLYKMEHPTQLAVKWLALESLVYYIFTEKSDVWSFGIVLWELVTLGSQPYAGLDNYEVMPYLETGKRLPRPLRCPDDLYSIMQSCWSASPEDRPWFSVLVHKLEDYELRLRPACILFEFDEDTIEMSDGLF